MNEVKNVVAITPVWNEPLVTIQRLESEMAKVRERLNKKDVSFRHFFLDDKAINLPPESRVLVTHKENLQLSQTLLDGYSKALQLNPEANLVVRLDSQEHDPQKIVEIVSLFQETKCEATILPMWYWLKGERPSMIEIYAYINKFHQAVKDKDEKVMLGTYNQVFPMGYQAFRSDFLVRLLKRLLQAQKKYEKLFQEKMTWGLDLLAILLTAEMTENWDIIFSGFMPPWLENRGADKIEAQKNKARKMVEVFQSMTK